MNLKSMTPRATGRPEMVQRAASIASVKPVSR